MQLVPRRRPTSLPCANALAEVVGGSDVLERQEPAFLDRQHLGDVDRPTEGELDPLGIGDHREQCVDALHLGVPQMVARAAGHRVVPGDVELLEQVDRAVADLGEEVVRRELDREANGVGTLVLLVDAGHAGLVGQRQSALLPGHREFVVLAGVGVRLPGSRPRPAAFAGASIHSRDSLCRSHRQFAMGRRCSSRRPEGATEDEDSALDRRRLRRQKSSM